MTIRPTAILKTSARSTRILVHLDGDDVLKAILSPPSTSPHPRALVTLLEAVALWYRAPVRRLRRYLRPSLLVLDELGYVPCDGRAADVLYNIVSRRHASRSTIITTNLAFKQWGNVFPGAACVAALIDRFNQHCHKLLITADSWRETHPFDHDTEKSSDSKQPRKQR